MKKRAADYEAEWNDDDYQDDDFEKDQPSKQSSAKPKKDVKPIKQQ